MGEKCWGIKRLKAPEEYVLRTAIDETTNVFTLGALIFDFFGRYMQAKIENRYRDERFLSCATDKWTLDEEAYFVVLKAVNFDRTKRYKTISDFRKAFHQATRYK